MAKQHEEEPSSSSANTTNSWCCRCRCLRHILLPPPGANLLILFSPPPRLILFLEWLIPSIHFCPMAFVRRSVDKNKQIDGRKSEKNREMLRKPKKAEAAAAQPPPTTAQQTLHTSQNASFIRFVSFFSFPFVPSFFADKSLNVGKHKTNGGNGKEMGRKNCDVMMSKRRWCSLLIALEFRWMIFLRGGGDGSECFPTLMSHGNFASKWVMSMIFQFYICSMT